MLLHSGLFLKGSAPTGGGLFDEGGVVSSDREIGYVAQWWIIEKPTGGEFLVIELTGVSR